MANDGLLLLLRGTWRRRPPTQIPVSECTLVVGGRALHSVLKPTSESNVCSANLLLSCLQKSMPRTLLPSGSRRGENVQMPMTPGMTTISAPATPLLLGKPIVNANSGDTHREREREPTTDGQPITPLAQRRLCLARTATVVVHARRAHEREAVTHGVVAEDTVLSDWVGSCSSSIPIA